MGSNRRKSSQNKQIAAVIRRCCPEERI